MFCCSKGSHQLIHFAKHRRFSCSFLNKTTVSQASVVLLYTLCLKNEDTHIVSQNSHKNWALWEMFGTVNHKSILYNLPQKLLTQQSTSCSSCHGNQDKPAISCGRMFPPLIDGCHLEKCHKELHSAFFEESSRKAQRLVLVWSLNDGSKRRRCSGSTHIFTSVCSRVLVDESNKVWTLMPVYIGSVFSFGYGCNCTSQFRQFLLQPKFKMQFCLRPLLKNVVFVGLIKLSLSFL